MSKNIGYIHSFETFGTVDGPGIRFVVFMQGCPMRCLYCHNPDSWEIGAGERLSVEDVIRRYEGVKEFCKGGITVTGGEPLMQIDFVTDLFKTAHKNKIHTALDTSGICFNPNDTSKIDNLLDYTSLVLLDIKHINDAEHIKLTGKSNKNILEFAQYLSDKKIPVWIRHVVAEGINYNEFYLKQLGEFLAKLHNVQALDVLPYHDMAKPKYEKLGINYPLKDIPPLSKEQAINARNIILSGMNIRH